MATGVAETRLQGAPGSGWQISSKPGRSSVSAAGITLIEIIVVLAMVSLFMGIAIPMASSVTSAHLKASAGTVAGAIRYMFNLSGMTGAYCRMQFELQGQGYKAECADKPFYLARTLETATGEGERAEHEDDEADKTRLSSDEEEMQEREKLKAAFREIKTTLIRNAKLPEEIRFDGVWTSHQRDRYTKGFGHLYFFPGGYTEKAYIHLADEKANSYTLIVSPLTGRVLIEPKYVEAPEK
ncbi:MAG: hypothetical protein HY897_09320 [Deltaproteobacteria bacterium]|nr:hypothetical protein [Deltaproteobacteria bacterium]